MNYEGKTALVLGLGESGLAIALWLARGGARVRVADTRDAPARLPALVDAVPDAQFVAGPFVAGLLDGVDFVAVSPGLAPNRELAEIVPAAAGRHIPVWGEIELFAQALSSLKAQQGYSSKVIAITGTNGKTTVTSLTGLLCRRAGLSTRVAGNISPAALDVLRECLDKDELPQAWVLELSSFQLHTTYSLNADAATVLNLTQDHLDWHGSMAAYAADKARIFGADTVRILNRDDATVMAMTAPGAQVTTFGTGEPDAPGSFGLVSERGVLWLANANPAEEPEKKRKKNEPAEPVELVVNRLMPADALRIRGLHNASNALAALALCRAVGLPLAPLLHGLREYAGEPHRVELVASIDGIDYYDDSKGTNVGATVAALEGLGKTFGESDRQILLVAGGDGKGQDFAPLAAPVSRYVRAVLLIGRDAPSIRATLEPTGVPCFDLPGLPEAVRRASGLAKQGDVVLLSPACASLDMFTNYAHRAQVFVDAVRDIALEKGLGNLMAFQIPFKFSGTSADATIAARARPSRMMEYDQPLVWVVVLLMLFGMVMVYSASIALPDSPKFTNLGGKNNYFLLRQAAFIAVSLVAGLFTFRIPVATWQRCAPLMFVATLVLLGIVLVPGLGHAVNGAKRWIPLKIIQLQPSEIMKVVAVLYAADFTVRKQQYMHKLTKGFMPMAFAMGVVGALLMLEPDMGALGVIVCISMGILFLGGFNMIWFGGIGAVLVLVFSSIIAFSPFRRARMFAYMDPWQEDYALGKAYQLTHSLIAFGRGEIFGVGLGGSVEKLHYLPEAHTDFIMAVIGEELGLIGVLAVIGMFYWLVKRAFDIGRQAIALEQHFAGLTAKGMGIWLGVQVFINMGVNLGLLPTKGLTLPLMSYGGSGVLFNCVGLAILLRVDYENRVRMRGGRQ